LTIQYNQEFPPGGCGVFSHRRAFLEFERYQVDGKYRIDSVAGGVGAKRGGVRVVERVGDNETGELPFWINRLIIF